MSKNNNNDRKLRVTGNDVALAMLVGGGCDAVRELHNKSEIAPATFAKAVVLLEARPETAAELSELAEELCPAGTGQRGRPSVAIGDTRSYRTQEVGDTGCFIRLPVGLLGAAKGEPVKVAFSAGKITVTF